MQQALSALRAPIPETDRRPASPTGIWHHPRPGHHEEKSTNKEDKQRIRNQLTEIPTNTGYIERTSDAISAVVRSNILSRAGRQGRLLLLP